MQKHRIGKVVVFFGNFPLTIRLPAASQDEQLDFLRDRIIFHANNLVEHGLWEEPLSDVELEKIMADVEIEPVFFPSFCFLAYPWEILKNLFRC